MDSLSLSAEEKAGALHWWVTQESIPRMVRTVPDLEYGILMPGIIREVVEEFLKGNGVTEWVYPEKEVKS